MGEGVPEAGPRRPSRGISGGPDARSVRKQGAGTWDLAVEGAPDQEVVAVVRHGRAVLGSSRTGGGESGPRAGWSDRERQWLRCSARAQADNAEARAHASRNKTEAAPRGDDQRGHGWCARYQPRRHARSGMPSGHPASLRSFTVPTPVRAYRVKGQRSKGRSGWCEPVARECVDLKGAR